MLTFKFYKLSNNFAEAFTFLFRLNYNGEKIGMDKFDFEIGTVIADDVLPSFDVFRFKANATEYVYPGTLVATRLSEKHFLIGRISASIEINPHESASRAKVREAMGIGADQTEVDGEIFLRVCSIISVSPCEK